MTYKWWMPLYGVFFGIYIPREFQYLKGKVILHLADTPSTFYCAVRRLVHTLEPIYVIHTGDLADDVKLELNPGDLQRYRRKLVELRSAISPRENRKLVIVTGNHDDEMSVRDIFPDAMVFLGKGRIEIEGEGYNLSHDRNGLEGPPARFNLFGHEPSGDETDDSHYFLNGVNAVHIISPASGAVYCLPYPGYVNDGRLLRRKRGL